MPYKGLECGSCRPFFEEIDENNGICRSSKSGRTNKRIKTYDKQCKWKIHYDIEVKKNQDRQRERNRV